MATDFKQVGAPLLNLTKRYEPVFTALSGRQRSLQLDIYLYETSPTSHQLSGVGALG
jgi:hypothetical protein